MNSSLKNKIARQNIGQPSHRGFPIPACRAPSAIFELAMELDGTEKSSTKSYSGKIFIGSTGPKRYSKIGSGGYRTLFSNPIRFRSSGADIAS